MDPTLEDEYLEPRRRRKSSDDDAEPASEGSWRPPPSADAGLDPLGDLFGDAPSSADAEVTSAPRYAPDASDELYDDYGPAPSVGAQAAPWGDAPAPEPEPPSGSGHGRVRGGDDEENLYVLLDDSGRADLRAPSALPEPAEEEDWPLVSEPGAPPPASVPADVADDADLGDPLADGGAEGSPFRLLDDSAPPAEAPEPEAAAAEEPAADLAAPASGGLGLGRTWTVDDLEAQSRDDDEYEDDEDDEAAEPGLFEPDPAFDLDSTAQRLRDGISRREARRPHQPSRLPKVILLAGLTVLVSVVAVVGFRLFEEGLGEPNDRPRPTISEPTTEVVEVEAPAEPAPPPTTVEGKIRRALSFGLPIDDAATEER